MPKSSILAISAALGLAVALGVGLTACENKRDKLLDFKFEKRQALDDLYKTYGGGELAKGIRDEAKGAAAEIKQDEGEQANVAADIIDTIGEMAVEMDRGAFESQCLAIGQGDRPMILNATAREFFTARANAETCRKVAKLHIEIRALENELGIEPGAPPPPASP